MFMAMETACLWKWKSSASEESSDEHRVLLCVQQDPDGKLIMVQKH